MNDTFPKAEQPEKIKIPLKPHQLTMISRCKVLEDTSHNPIIIRNDSHIKEFKTKFGIIGDVVGSGKTFSVLGLIASDSTIKTQLPKVYSNSYVNYCETTIQDSQVNKLNIIVVPHTIFKQWAEVIEKFTSLSYIGINNTKTEKEFIRIYDSDEEFAKVDHQIVLISNTRIKNVFQQQLKYFNYTDIFSRIIIDEADMLKIPQHLFMNASFTWFVTSSYDTLLTPYRRDVYLNEQGVENSYYDYSRGFIYRKVKQGLTHSGFIKNTMLGINTIPRSYRELLVLKNNNDYVKLAFNLEDYRLEIMRCKTPYYLKILTSNVSQNIIDHINAGDIKGAIEELDCPKFKETDLIQGITFEYDKKLKNLVIDLEAIHKKTFSSEEAKKQSIKNVEEKITKVKGKIESIQTKLKESTMCSICYDDIEHTSVAPCCNTKYCLKCISTWLKDNKNCPFCRSTIDMNSLIIVTEDVVQKKKREELNTKLENLKYIIEKQIGNPEFKMLIFSDFHTTFDLITDMLDKFELKHTQVVGTTATIANKIKKFKTYSGPDKIDVLLLNASYCANGINLENTTDIVFFHNMNKDKTNQVIGRGQRPGRKGRLNVWKLCYENELK